MKDIVPLLGDRLILRSLIFKNVTIILAITIINYPILAFFITIINYGLLVPAPQKLIRLADSFFIFLHIPIKDEPVPSSPSTSILSDANLSFVSSTPASTRKNCLKIESMSFLLRKQYTGNYSFSQCTAVQCL